MTYRLIATPEGAGRDYVNRRPEWRGVLANVVTPQTRLEDRTAQFHAMSGHTIAETVRMRIEGAHARPSRNNRLTKKSEHSWLAVY